MRLATPTRWTAAMLGVLIGIQPTRAASPADVQSAIDRGRAWLFAHQTDGNWEAVQRRNADPAPFSVESLQWGGMTGIATVALLASGTDANDPHMKAAVEWLRRADLHGTYAVSVRAQVWPLLPQPAPWVRQAELADLRSLLEGVHVGKQAGAAAGLYGYPLTGGAATEGDHSAGQFGVLGVASLERDGLEVPNAYWQLIEEAWHRQQTPGGGWGYYAHPDPADPNTFHGPGVNMTAAGLATLFIAQEYLNGAPRCNGNLTDANIEAGLKYLGQHITDPPPYGHYYGLFGVSRVGLASGFKYLGNTDWFQWGSDTICRDQNPAGGWETADTTNNRNGVPDTAFSLLFLSRGRAPVMLNKLSYEVTTGPGKGAKPTAAAWDQRPRDAANLSRWVGRQIETQLNWQIVTLRQSQADLHEAPILYMSGARAPKLSNDDAARLRTYLEDGGLLLGHADCASSDFAKGFKALGEQLFPTAKFRALEPTSPILTNEQFPAAQWKSGKPVIEALSNGSRELMVLLPTGDPARTWQTQSFGSEKHEVYGQLMADLFLYSVDKEGLRRRGETYLVARKDGGPAGRPVKVARLRYAGNWDPEPGGWRRLASALHNDGAAELTTDAVDGAIDKSYGLASLTVASADAKLSDAQRQAIGDYVRGGGTLLVDAAGGRSLYRAAAEAEIAKIFPEAPRDLPVLPANSPVFTGGKKPLGPVDFRRFQRSGNSHVPAMRGYTVGGRVAVLYSPEDLSTGLVGEPVDGVAGYAPASALAVVEHVVAFAGKQG